MSDSLKEKHQIGGITTSIKRKGFKTEGKSTKELRDFFEKIKQIDAMKKEVNEKIADYVALQKSLGKGKKTMSEAEEAVVDERFKEIQDLEKKLQVQQSNFEKAAEKFELSEEEEAGPEEEEEEPEPEQLVDDSDITFSKTNKEDEFQLDQKAKQYNKKYKAKEAKQNTANEKFANHPLGGLNSTSGVAKYTLVSRMGGFKLKSYSLY